MQVLVDMQALGGRHARFGGTAVLLELEMVDMQGLIDMQDLVDMHGLVDKQEMSDMQGLVNMQALIDK